MVCQLYQQSTLLIPQGAISPERLGDGVYFFTLSQATSLFCIVHNICFLCCSSFDKRSESRVDVALYIRL